MKRGNFYPRIEPSGPTVDSQIRRELTAILPEDFFRRSPGRLVYLAVAWFCMLLHLWVTAVYVAGGFHLVIYLLTLAAAAGTFPFFLFTLHELGHGAIVRARWARALFGALAGFWIPFQPAFWSRTHSHHHAHANMEADTDRLKFYDRGELGARFFDFNLRNFVSIPSATFALQIVYLHCFLGFLLKQIDYPMSRTRAVIQVTVHLFVLVTFLALMGWWVALLGYLPVLVLGSAMQNMYVITNHLTRPLTSQLDALSTGLSVHFYGKSHMGFGRHVEHHLFPGVSHAKLRLITRLLRERYPERFQEMPIHRAVGRLFNLPGYFYSYKVLTDRRGRLKVPID